MNQHDYHMMTQSKVHDTHEHDTYTDSCGKETLWRGLCNNKNNYNSKLTNINETLNQT